MLSSWICKEEILALGQTYGFDADHAALVNRLALRFFDQLQPIHRMGATERLWLSTAAWLHDIAKPSARKGHHKRAEAIILHDRSLPLHEEARYMIAYLTRFHRGTPPHVSSHIRHLPLETQNYLGKLSALLRLADGLDRGAKGYVEDVRCRFDSQFLYLDIIADRTFSLNKFHRKSKLFQEIHHHEILPQILVQPPESKFLLDSEAWAPYAESR